MNLKYALPVLIVAGVGLLSEPCTAKPAPARSTRSAPVGALVVPPPAPLIDLDAASYAQWASLVGTGFAVTGEQGSTNVVLASVELVPARVRPRQFSRREAFILHFTSPAGQTAVPGGVTYQFFNAKYAAFTLLLSGKSTDAGGDHFLAVMN